MEPSRPTGAGGEAGPEQKEALVEDGDAGVLVPSVNKTLWGSNQEKRKRNT